jgi:hypothetical protein
MISQCVVEAYFPYYFLVYISTRLHTDSRLRNKKTKDGELKDTDGSGLCTFHGTDVVHTWRDCVKRRKLSRIFGSYSSGYEEIHLLVYSDI